MKVTTNFKAEPSDKEDKIFDSILKFRSISKNNKKDFLNPPSPTLPLLISKLSLDEKELSGAVALAREHLAKNHDILIYGDYDADGITSTAILYKTLTKLAADTTARILPFIPDRLRHGYGLSRSSINEIIDGVVFKDSSYPDFSPSLIITVDTGIVAIEEVKLIRDNNIDLIITDHHQKEKSAPPANSIIHSLESSGSVVSWTFALALSDSDQEVGEMLDLATIGLVADQISLTGINRTLTYHGIEKLKKTDNLGIQKLMQVAGRDLESLSTYDINFTLAPRINATGRLANAVTALRLLCSNNPNNIASLANEINDLNQERKNLTLSGINGALEHSPENKIIVVSSTKYHEGVVGLIAGRLVEQHHRPALAISVGKNIAKGSARSLGNINVTNLLRKFEEYFEGLGGHKLAAGFSLKPEKIAELTKKLYAYANKNIKDSDLTLVRQVETELSLKQASITLARLVEQLAPFGRGNAQPRFLSRNLTVLEDKKLGAEGIHRKLTLEQNGTTREAIWFNCKQKYPITKLDSLIFTLNINVWRERESLQLVVKHAEL